MFLIFVNHSIIFLSFIFGMEIFGSYGLIKDGILNFSRAVQETIELGVIA